MPVVEADGLAVDSRFVQRLGEDFKLRFTNQHGVLLFSSPPNLVAFVLLYGTHPYFVHLSKDTTENDTWLRTYEFSYSKDGHGELDQLEFARRMLATTPSSLGVSQELAGQLLQELEESKHN